MYYFSVAFIIFLHDITLHVGAFTVYKWRNVHRCQDSKHNTALFGTLE